VEFLDCYVLYLCEIGPVIYVSYYKQGDGATLFEVVSEKFNVVRIHRLVYIMLFRFIPSDGGCDCDDGDGADYDDDDDDNNSYAFLLFPNTSPVAHADMVYFIQL
jgi:hypothetical protein